MKHFHSNNIIRILAEKKGHVASKGTRQWLLLKQFNGKTVEEFHLAARTATRNSPAGTYQSSNWWDRELDYCWSHGIIRVESHEPTATANVYYGEHADQDISIISKEVEREPPAGKISNQKERNSMDLNATGIYIAYPTTSTLKPIYRGYKTMVNNQHTKVGMAQDSFRSRRNGYLITFNGEIDFIPVAKISLDILPQIEKIVISSVAKQYEKIGRSQEWFATSDHQSVIGIILRILKEKNLYEPYDIRS